MCENFRASERSRYVEPAALTEPLNAMPETMMIASDRDIVAARQRGRTYVLQLGFSSPEATLVATAISELARNIVLYAKEGAIELQPVEQNGRPGVLIIARDEGPGISDVLRAAIDAPSESRGVMGLRAMKRLVDEFEIESRAGFGTRVAVKKWKT
jgi:serine/threonine-protein kinase RsbT